MGFEMNEVLWGIFFIMAVSLSAATNKIFLRFSVNLGTRNTPELIRWTATKKPSVGGFSFYIVFLLSMVGAFVLKSDHTFYSIWQLLGLMGACSLGFFIGLADDAYNTKPFLKFGGQLACAHILFFCGVAADVCANDLVNYSITLFWVVGLMNSLNMLDNMDGITASTSGCILLGCLGILIPFGLGGYSLLIIVLAGIAALVGFLIFNWHPAKMYMGDTGSQFIGAALAGISLLTFWPSKQINIITHLDQATICLLVLLLFCIPLIDTTTVFIRRIARGQSPFVGGRDHTTHHLAYCGLKDHQVALVFLLLSLFHAVAVIYIVNSTLSIENWHKYLVGGYIVALFCAFQWFYQIGKKKQLEKEA